MKDLVDAALWAAAVKCFKDADQDLLNEANFELILQVLANRTKFLADNYAKLVSDGQVFTGRQVFTRNGQISRLTAAIEALSITGDVWISLEASGATAGALRHVRGGNGLEVRDSGGNLARLKIAPAVALDDAATKAQVDVKLDATKIYHGRIYGNGTVASLPPGWSCVRTSVGWYTITHNLGLPQASVGQYTYTVIPSAPGSSSANLSHVTNSNSFALNIYLGGVASDQYWQFIMMRG